MALEPLDSLTRICLARQLSPETWLRLFQEAKAKNEDSKDNLEASPHNVDLQAIDYVLSTIRTSPTTALGQSYLQACLVADGPKKHLLNKLLETAPDSSEESASPEDTAFLESLAATLLASDAALVSKVQPAKSTQEAYQRLKAVVRLLAIAARAQLSSLFVLTLQLLQLPLPQQRQDLDEGLKRGFVEDIASCRDALNTMTDSSTTLPYPVEMAHKHINQLERILNPLANRKRTFHEPPTFPSMPLELEILLQGMLYDNCVGAISALRGSILARLAVQRAISDEIQATDRQEVLNEWCGDLFRSCSSHASLLDEPKDRSEARWRAFIFGRLPNLLAELRNDPGLSKFDLDWSAAIDKGLQICLERNDGKGQGALAEWTKGAKDYLLTPQEVKVETSDQSPEDLIGLLEDGLHDYGSQAHAAATVASHISKWTANSDLPALQHFLLSLIKQTPRMVDYVLLHYAPEALFKPICHLLQAWDSVDEYGAGQAMELYGGILLALRTLVRRHTLQESFAQFGYSIAAAITASSATLGKPASLHALSDQQRQLVASWITALYGSEGIEDDLIRATPPRTMLVLAPTIVHQSMLAMENGIIDQETLLNGLSYFCQDFLTFALPSIISYLATRPQPSLQVINPLLSSESTPACVLELVQDDLRVMLGRMDPTDEDVKVMGRRFKDGPGVAPLNKSSLNIALATGSEVVQNLRASFKSRDKLAIMDVIVGTQDPFMASLGICQEKSHVVDTLKEFLQRVLLKQDDDGTDRLADLVALVFIRMGVDMEKGQYSPAFQDRLQTWRDV